jgi:hypothetical protein
MGTAFDFSKYDRIINYIKLVQDKPKLGCEFFYFDYNKRFVVSGDKLKIKPKTYQDLYLKDECYIHVDPDLRRVIYYGFDIENFITGKRINEVEGVIEWDQAVEDIIYNFFVMNIKDLSSSVVPYMDAHSDKETKKNNFSSFGSAPFGSAPSQSGYVPPANYNNQSSGFISHYREREAFTEKLFARLKANETAVAMDYIDEEVGKFLTSKKFTCVDDMLRFIAMDKLTIPAMIEILSATRGADHILKDRTLFFNKVKDYIAKVKPSKVEHLLGALAPGKEYAGVAKYAAGAPEAN